MYKNSKKSYLSSLIDKAMWVSCFNAEAKQSLYHEQRCKAHLNSLKNSDGKTISLYHWKNKEQKCLI